MRGWDCVGVCCDVGEGIGGVVGCMLMSMCLLSDIDVDIGR